MCSRNGNQIKGKQIYMKDVVCLCVISFSIATGCLTESLCWDY